MSVPLWSVLSRVPFQLRPHILLHASIRFLSTENSTRSLCACSLHHYRRRPNNAERNLSLSRHFSEYNQNKSIPSDSDESNPETPNSESSGARGSIADSYIPFEDEKQIIQDVVEQEWSPIPQRMTESRYPREHVNRERGQTGVFDLEELVGLLRDENAADTCVIAIPKEINYVDYMVIITARSPRHMFALANFIRRRFKFKDLKSHDKLPKIEGSKNSEDWIALDLGNIALHIFTFAAREEVDLETLWTVGPQYDDLTNTKESDIVQLLSSFSNTRNSLENK